MWRRCGGDAAEMWRSVTLAVALALAKEPDAVHTCRRAEDFAEVRHALTRHDSSGAPDEHAHLICYGALSGPA